MNSPSISKAALEAEIERIKKNHGCARNQGTTQFCAEAVAVQAELSNLRADYARAMEYLAAIDATRTTRPRNTKNKQRRIKARKMWAYANPAGNILYPFAGEAGTVPVFVIPADRASYEAMRDQGADAMMSAHLTHSGSQSHTDLASIFLASIGITAPRKP